MLNQARGKKKVKDLKQQRVKEKKHSDTKSSNSTNEDSKSKRMKSKRENTTCHYCRGSIHEISCFRNNMDIMTNILEENNIDVPYFARRGEHKLSLEKENGKCMHALSARKKPIPHIYVLDVFVSYL